MPITGLAMSLIEEDPSRYWFDREPYRTLIDAAGTLEQRGASFEELVDAFLSLSLSFSVDMFGPRAVSERLYALAARFEAEADKADAAAGGGAGGNVH
jgi:hypothetical protein